MVDNLKIALIQAHYTKATYKHPEFCSSILGAIDKETAEAWLKRARDSRRIEASAANILNEEVCEIFEAYAKGEKEHAIDECYDAIAVLVRMAEFIKSEKEGEA